MGFSLSRRARGRKRRLFGKAPDGKELGERLVRIAPRMLGEWLRDSTAKRLTLDLHPAAGPIRIVVLPEGELEVTGDTGTIGPGYHAHVVALIEPLLDELDLAWADGEDDPRVAMTAWLARELAAGTTRFGVPAERCFRITAPVLTAMGPREAAWRDAVIADPSRGADAFAWWDDGPGQLERSRALLAMWHEVPWREPLDGDERALMMRVDKDLKAARKAKLDVPYAEWAELRDCLGDDEKAAELHERAAGRVPSIGYRRYPLEIELDGGWTIELPGSFVGAWEDDRYWATDGDRMIEVTCLSTNGELDSDALLAVAPEAHPVVERLSDGQRRGRVEVYDEGDVHVVHGLMASTPEVAILTCKGTRTDEPWALATWRSLAR